MVMATMRSGFAVIGDTQHPSKREDPAVKYSDEKHGALRSAITLELERLMRVEELAGH